MMQVLGPRALVAPLDPPAQASKLIEVVQFEKKPSQFVFVIAVGNGERQIDGTRRPLPFVAGDVLLVKPFVGAPVTYTGSNGEPEDALMLMEEDVLAIVEGL